MKHGIMRDRQEDLLRIIREEVLREYELFATAKPEEISAIVAERVLHKLVEAGIEVISR